MKPIIEVRAISILCTKLGPEQGIITYDKKGDKYKSHLYPHNKTLTKARIREFFDDFNVIFPAFLNIQEGEEE